MKEKYLVLWASLMTIFIGTLGVSMSYLGTKVSRAQIYPTNLKTGSLNLRIVDSKLEDVFLTPIYDRDYYNSAYKKNFIVVSKDGSLNSCTSIYLDISEISDELKSEYLKYKLVTEDGVFEGNFKNANTEEDLLLAGNIFIEEGSKKEYSLYIWISYDDDIDQTYLLNKNFTSKVVVKSYDSETINTCKNN